MFSTTIQILNSVILVTGFHKDPFWDILFLIYVDDMIYCSRILQFVLFADDTNVFLTNKNVNELFDIVNVEFIALSNWFTANKLPVNVSKTNFMIFTKCNRFQRLCALKRY